MRVILAFVLAISLTGCNTTGITPEPTSVPSPTVTNSMGSSAPSKAPSSRAPEPEQTAGPTKTTPSPSAVDAGTPAIQFAARWGKQYPNVPEYMILKTANAVCAITSQYPDWTSNPISKNMVESAVVEFGLNSNDTVAFTVDAQQNYCSSTGNPT